MSFSVNTNAGALAALGNLNRTTASLETTQSRINTGLKVASAKDNGATFAIAQTLRSDVAGYRAVSSSLDRASSELDVAMAGAEAISDLLIQMKEKAVAAKDEGLDDDSRTSLNDDYQQLLAQITSISENASFNGRNLLTGDTLSAITDAAGDSTITASVTSLTTTSLAMDTTALTGGGVSDPNNAEVILGPSNPLNSGDQLAALNNYLSDNYSHIYNNNSLYNQSTGGFLSAGSILEIGMGMTSDFGVSVDMVVDGASLAMFISNGPPLYVEGTGADAQFTLNDTASQVGSSDASSGGAASEAVDAVEAAIETVNTVMSDLGSTANRVDLQQQFAGSLSDSIDVGIGNLVDADMARESANLQAFQTKQQLGLQALSIANQAPQSVLSLFG